MMLSPHMAGSSPVTSRIICNNTKQSSRFRESSSELRYSSTLASLRCVFS